MANRTQMAMGPRQATVHLGNEGENMMGYEGVGEKKYEERIVEGKGRGLFLKEGQSLEAGEVVLVDYPSLLIARDAMDVLLPEERYRMNWLGVMQLPDDERHAVRSLNSKGKYADEVDNIVAMNALGVQYGGFKHLGMFPEAAVCAFSLPCTYQTNEAIELTENKPENKPRLYTKVSQPIPDPPRGSQLTSTASTTASTSQPSPSPSSPSAT